MKLVQVFCLISSLTATIALPNPFARNDALEVSGRGGGDGDGHRRLLKGKIAVTSASGSIGFISRFKSDFGTYVADTRKAHAATFSFSPKKWGKSTGLLLKDETTDTRRTPFLGGVVPHGYELEKRKTAGAAKGSGTEGSAPNKPPHPGQNSFNSNGHGPVSRGDGGDGGHGGHGGHGEHPSTGDIESAIWTYDPETKGFSAVWTQPDYSQLGVTFFYDTCKPFGLVLVTDVTGYTFSNPEAFQISLTFVPNHEKEDN